jgi:hypothetical protein
MSKNNLRMTLPKGFSLDLYDSPEALLEALLTKGVRVSEKSRNVIKKLECFRPRKYYNVYVVFPRELGFIKKAQYKDIVQRAREQGYWLCPDICGPYIAQAYTVRAWNYSLAVASKIIQTDTYGIIFEIVYNKGKIELEAGPCDPYTTWDLETAFVFLR